MILKIFLAICLIIFLSFGQIFFFDIWQDDNALIFKIQHPQEQAGVFGAGIFGVGAYKFIATPYILLSQVVGVNIQLFYLVGLVFYTLVAFAIYRTTKLFTNNNVISLSASFIFASGFVGSESVMRLFNSLQTSISIILVLVAFSFYYLFLQRLSLLYFFIAIIAFWWSIEIGYARVQYIIIPIIILWVLFIQKWSHKNLWQILSIIPITGIYYNFYLLNPDSRSGLVIDYFRSISSFNFEYLYSFFSSFGYFVIPDYLLNIVLEGLKIVSNNLVIRFLVVEIGVFFSLVIWIFKFVKIRKLQITQILGIIFWFVFHFAFFVNGSFINEPISFTDARSILASFFGGLFLLLSIFLILTPSSKSYRKLGIFLLSWIISNILVYSIYLPFNPLESTSRYLTHSFPAYSVLISMFLYFVIKQIVKGKDCQMIFSLCVFIVVLIYIGLSLYHQMLFIKNKSEPTKQFYNQLKTYIPKLEKGSILFFQVAPDGKSKQQFADFFSVGSMPDSTAIAIRYDLDRDDIYLPKDFKELEQLMKDKKGSINKIYSLYYSKNGLINKTSSFLSILESKNSFKLNETIELISVIEIKPERTEVSNPQKIISNINLPVYPVKLKFKAKAFLNINENLIFPMVNGKKTNDCIDTYTNDEIESLINFETSTNKLMQLSSFETNSEEKTLYKKNLFDDDTFSVWRGNRGYWMTNHREEIIISFSDFVSPKKLIWYNSYPNTTPINYKILQSTDGKTWVMIKEVKSEAKRTAGRVIEDINTKQIKYLKLEILDTFDDDSPAISEIKVIDVDKIPDDLQVKKFFDEFPDCFMNSEQFNKVFDYSQNEGVITKVEIFTDNLESKSFKITPDDTWQDFEIYFPVSGNLIDKIIFGPTFIPSNISISDLKVIYPR